MRSAYVFLQLELGSISPTYVRGGVQSLFSSVARAQEQAEISTISNSAATLASNFQDYLASSSAEATAELKSINDSTAQLAQNLRGILDASAQASKQEFSALRIITASFLDSFHSMIDKAANTTVAQLKTLTNATSFLTKEMKTNTLYTTTAAGAGSASLAMSILVLLSIGLVKGVQVCVCVCVCVCVWCAVCAHARACANFAAICDAVHNSTCGSRAGTRASRSASSARLSTCPTAMMTANRRGVNAERVQEIRRQRSAQGWQLAQEHHRSR